MDERIRTGGLEVLTPPEALDLLGRGLDLERVGPLAGRPAIVVRLDPGPALHVLGPLVRRLPCVTIGVADQPWAHESDHPGAVETGNPGAFDVLVTRVPSAPAPWVSSEDLSSEDLSSEDAGPSKRTGDPADALATLARSIEHAPLAALALVQLLRASTTVGTTDAIILESFAYSTLQAGPEFRGWLARRGRCAKGASERDGSSEQGTPSVLVDRQDSTLTLTLNRPAVHNAVNRSVRDELSAALLMACADPTLARVELRGAGPSFCSGGDLTEFGTMPDPSTAHAVRTSRSLAGAVAACAPRTTAFVHGATVGAGLELASFAHRVVATPDSWFCLPELALGLVPGAGGTASLPRRIGRQRSAFLALTGARLGLGAAVRWGLVDEVSAQ